MGVPIVDSLMYFLFGNLFSNHLSALDWVGSDPVQTIRCLEMPQFE
jgi:hypothetical protein